MMVYDGDEITVRRMNTIKSSREHSSYGLLINHEKLPFIRNDLKLRKLSLHDTTYPLCSPCNHRKML